MASCIGCREEIVDNQESVSVPLEFGGGTMHENCWLATLEVAKRVIHSLEVDGNG